MDENSSSDYYRYKWTTIIEKEPSFREKLLFVVVLNLVIVGLVFGTWMFNEYMKFDRRDFFYLMSFFWLVIVMVLGWVWSKLLLSKRAIVKKYAIDRVGITIGGKLVKYEWLNKDKLRAKLSEFENQQKQDGEFWKSEVRISGRRRKYKLRFDSPDKFARVVTGLGRYLKDVG